MLTVKLRLPAIIDAQHGGFATGWSPVSWGSIDEFFVNLTMPPAAMRAATTQFEAHLAKADEAEEEGAMTEQHAET